MLRFLAAFFYYLALLVFVHGKREVGRSLAMFCASLFMIRDKSAEYAIKEWSISKKIDLDTDFSLLTISYLPIFLVYNTAYSMNELTRQFLRNDDERQEMCCVLVCDY